MQCSAMQQSVGIEKVVKNNLKNGHKLQLVYQDWLDNVTGAGFTEWIQWANQVVTYFVVISNNDENKHYIVYYACFGPNYTVQ